MRTNPDYYKILGVRRDATPADIKSAYRRLAHRYHPDVNAADTEAETRFKDINEAVHVLLDPDKRRRYDARLDAPGATVKLRARQQPIRRSNRRTVRVGIKLGVLGFSTEVVGGDDLLKALERALRRAAREFQE